MIACASAMKNTRCCEMELMWATGLYRGLIQVVTTSGNVVLRGPSAMEFHATWVVRCGRRQIAVFAVVQVGTVDGRTAINEAELIVPATVQFCFCEQSLTNVLRLCGQLLATGGFDWKPACMYLLHCRATATWAAPGFCPGSWKLLHSTCLP